MGVVSLGIAILWACAFTWHYGFGIAALNSSQDSIICSSDFWDGVFGAGEGPWGLGTCLDLTTFDFGVITAAFTAGGFFSALNAGRVIDRSGKKRTAVIGAWLVIAGGVLMSLGTNLWLLIIARVLNGLAAGLATVVVPLYLAEVSPPAIAGSVGILCQLSICVGILTAQAVSLPLSAPRTGYWRYLPLCQIAVAAVQILTAPLVRDGKDPHDTLIYDVVDEERGLDSDDDDADGDGLAGDPAYRAPPGGAAAGAGAGAGSLTLWEVVRSKDGAVSHGLRTIMLAQFFQQLSGINAVMYFSVGILSKINPGSAKQIALIVTAVNVLMTFPPIYLIERLGRRSLILGSLGSMSLASITLAYSINNSYFSVAGVAIIAFVACFSIGLGPVPYVLMGEVPPPAARSAVASAGLGTNWGLNFFIGLLFLPVRDWLSGGEEAGSGTIFYVFAAISAVGVVVMGRLLAK